MKMVISLWRTYSKVVVGSDRKCFSNDLSDKVSDFTSNFGFVAVISLGHVRELVADELRSHPSLHQIFHNLA